MSLYRWHRRGSWIVERVVLKGLTVRKATGIDDRQRAAQFEEVLLKLVKHGRRDLVVAFIEDHITGPELMSNVERYGVTFQLVVGATPKERVARSSQPSRTDWVYILQRSDTGQIKIGFSYDVSRRIAELETAGGSRLSPLVVFPGGKRDEQDLHRRFAGQRRLGEWFDPSPDLLAVVEEKRRLPEAWGRLQLPVGDTAGGT